MDQKTLGTSVRDSCGMDLTRALLGTWLQGLGYKDWRTMERLFMGMHAGYLYSKDRILEAQERFEEASWTSVVEQPRFGSSARPRDTRVTRVTDCEGANPLHTPLLKNEPPAGE